MSWQICSHFTKEREGKEREEEKNNIQNTDSKASLKKGVEKKRNTYLSFSGSGRI